MEKPSIITDIAGVSLSYDGEPEDIPFPERESLPPIDLSDKRTWWFFKNGDDDEVIDIVSFAELWARTMQSQITGSTPLDTVWIEGLEAACDEFTTERHVAKAVAILARSWRHGEELRRVFDEYQGKANREEPDNF